MADIVPGAPRGTPATKELLPVRDCGDAAEGAAALVRLPTDESPSKFSVASQEWPDADIQSQLCAFAADDGLAEDIEALMDGLPSPGPMGSDGAPKGTPTKQMVNALETQLLPVCGLASHEEGIQLLRACLATGREDPTYGGFETQSESPVWGWNDDWALLRPELKKRTAPLSPKLPTEVMALPAAFFSRPYFCSARSRARLRRCLWWGGQCRGRRGWRVPFHAFADPEASPQLALQHLCSRKVA